MREREIRKKAIEWVIDEGLDIAIAIKKVWTNPELKELFFITPYLACIYGAPPTAPEPPAFWSDESDARWKPHGGRKSKKGKDQGAKGDWWKGKGKGTWGKWSKSDAYDNTMGKLQGKHNGQEICFKYNANQECDGKCGRLHICRVGGCLKHSCAAWRCPMAKKDVRANLTRKTKY